ncbi:MAG: peptide deformylase [Patescibacteria group bacterium]|jgi:peptide deformylase
MPIILPLVIQPNRILNTKSKNITLTELKDAKKVVELKELGQSMVLTMLENNGIGLAAPQIGKNVNLFVVHKDTAQTNDHLVLCNPQITFQSAKKTTMEEGCLSCPTIYLDIARSEKIRVKAYTLDNEKTIFKAKGMLAKVFQHEIDHLNGVLIINK